MGAPRHKPPAEITALLHRHRDGDPDALAALMPIVYEKLRAIAARQMRAQSPAHTLSPTALVHEAFLKLQDHGELAVADRTHFFAIAARAMRWILTDHARAKHRDKRGGAERPIPFDESVHSPAEPFDLGALERALKKLEAQDPRLCRVVELRQLVGLTIEQTADALGISPMTVKRDWTAARAWLTRELGLDDPTDE
jgi:RNA polymerase sigma factor (TIGR02999 family)